MPPAAIKNASSRRGEVLEPSIAGEDSHYEAMDWLLAWRQRIDYTSDRRGA